MLQCYAETEVECVHSLLHDVRLTNCLKVVELYLVWNDRDEIWTQISGCLGLQCDV